MHPFLQGHKQWFLSNKTFLETKYVMLHNPDVAHCEGQPKSFCYNCVKMFVLLEL